VQQLPLQAILRQFSQALDKSQNLSRPEIQRRQAMLIEKLCRHARATVPFYRDSGRLDALFDGDGTFHLDRWGEVPILTRTEIVDHHDAMLSERLPQEMLPVSDDGTSGSTGVPLKIKRTFMQTVAAHALISRAVNWNECGPITRLAVTDVLRADSDDGSQRKRAGAPGEQTIIPAHLSAAEQVAMIGHLRPTHVIAFPNLAEAWIGTGRRDELSSIKTMFSTGEVLRPEARSVLERELGIAVVNLYSATEAGPIAIAGGDGRLRISEETLLLEQPDGPVDPSRPVPVIVTPFYAYAMPLIRYAIGDYVRFSARRVRDTLGLRRLDSVLGHIVQETLDDVVLKFVTPATPDAQTVDRCVRALGKMVPGFNIRIQLVDRIDDDRANGKRFESCLSLVR
jgi:phenylacetate-CoA ligase